MGPFFWSSSTVCKWSNLVFVQVQENQASPCSDPAIYCLPVFGRIVYITALQNICARYISGLENLIISIQKYFYWVNCKLFLCTFHMICLIHIILVGGMPGSRLGLRSAEAKLCVGVPYVILSTEACLYTIQYIVCYASLYLPRCHSICH